MPHTPPFAAHRPAPDFAAILKRIEAALRAMTWGKPAVDPPWGIKAFEGNTPADTADGPWICTIASYTTPDGVERVDGAVTCFAEGLVCRLTPALAELAMDLAVRATAV